MSDNTEWQALSQLNPQIRQRIRERNKKDKALIIRPNIVVNKSININAMFSRPLPHRGYKFQQSMRQIPYIQSEDKIKIKRQFLFYSRTLRYIYLLIDQQDTQLWKLFKSQYENLVPQKQRPLLNMISCFNQDELATMKYNIDGFISGGLQVRLLISKNISDQKIRQIGQKIKEAKLTEIILQRKLGNKEKYNQLEKVTVIYNDLLDKFKQEYKLRIQNSMKKNIKPQHNFVNLDMSQSNMLIRKRLLQYCIKIKKTEQEIQIHQQFANYLKTYENQDTVNKIVKIIEKKARGQPEGKNSIANYRNQIKSIQKQEEKFCLDFQQDLVKIKNNDKMSEDEIKKIYFKVIKQYKNQHSIYEIINSSLRLSMTINQNKIKKMSTFIRYMYEAVRCFYKIQANANSQNLIFETVYRGGVISQDQLKELKQGQIIKNLGFLSATKNEKIASGFIPQSSPFPCLFIIGMNRKYLTQQYINSLEGFVVTKQIFQHMKQPEKFKEEEEVIFNPLNIFQVVQVIIKNESIQNTSLIPAYQNLVDRSHKSANIVILKYAPQVELLTKIEKGDAQAEKRFKQIKHHISKTIEQKNYDKGRILHERGRNIEALRYYEKAESKAEALTMQQKQTKISILNNLKEYKKLDSYTKQEVKNLQRENQLMQTQMTKSVKIDLLALMTKRTQILQTGRNYASTEKFAVDVSKEATKLQTQLQSQIRQTTPLQFMKFLKMDLKGSVLLAKSKFQNNDVQFSLNQTYRSFYLVDQVYSSLEKLEIPQISKSVFLLPKDKKFDNLKEAFKKFEPPMQKMQNQKQSYIQDSIKKMKKKRQEKAEAEIPQICNKINFYINPEKSISDRKSKDHVLSIYKALNEKDILQNYNADLKSTMDTLEDLRSTIQQLIMTENQIHDCYKSNLKATNQKLQVCLKSQKEVLQNRFGKFEKELQNNLDVRLKQQYLNTEVVREYTALNDFLIQYKNVDSSKEVENLRKNIKKKLTKKIQDEEKVDKSGQAKLTSEKTIIYESEMKQCKASTCNQNILQFLALQRQSKKQSSPILTLSSYKNRKDFEEHSKILQKMIKMHKEDEQINNGEHLLKDLNEKLELYINSDDISDSQRQQYQKWLAMCNEKIEQFQQKYLQTLRKSEELVQHYYWVAEVKLKMGQFKQAKKNLSRAKELLVYIYDQNQIKSVNRESVSKSIKQKLEQGTLTKTYARDITIKCYRLQAEIVGVYEQQSVRKKFLVQLQKMKKFVEKNAPDKICTQAQINEAVGFLASRCLFNEPKIKNTKAKIIREAYEESKKLRQSLLGPESEYIAIANCTIALIEYKCQKPNKKIIEQNCKNGMTIFQKLKKQIPDSDPKTTYLERQPNLYLYLMKLQSISNRITKQVDPLSHYQSYIDEFEKNRKDLKSLYIVQMLMSVGTQLSKQQKYKRQSQELLDKCYLQIENIQAMNTLSFAKVKQLACTLLSEVCTGDKQKKFKELMVKIKDYLILNPKPPSDSDSDYEPEPRPPSLPTDPRNVFEYTADIILECIGMDNKSNKKYRQK